MQLQLDQMGFLDFAFLIWSGTCNANDWREMPQAGCFMSSSLAGANELGQHVWTCICIHHLESQSWTWGIRGCACILCTRCVQSERFTNLFDTDGNGVIQQLGCIANCYGWNEWRTQEQDKNNARMLYGLYVYNIVILLYYCNMIEFAPIRQF